MLGNRKWRIAGLWRVYMGSFFKKALIFYTTPWLHRILMPCIKWLKIGLNWLNWLLHKTQLTVFSYSDVYYFDECSKFHRRKFKCDITFSLLSHCLENFQGCSWGKLLWNFSIFFGKYLYRSQFLRKL